MEREQIHRALSDDGTQIVGRVHGEGPPLVLVPGGPSDGEFGYRSLVPRLVGTFGCHAMSNRGKGLSADHPDHSLPRLIDDVRAYVESLGEPVALFGQSSGGLIALEAAARTSVVSALALYEPANFDVLPDEQLEQMPAIFAGMAAALEEGRAVDAARTFYEQVALAGDDEMQALDQEGTFALAAANLPSVLRQVELSGPPRLTDASVPDAVTVPVLVLTGEHSPDLFLDASRDLAARLPDSRIEVIPGARHLGPQLDAEAVAASLTAFFAGARVSA